MSQTRTTVGPHDNEIHLARLGGIENLLKGDAMYHGNLPRKPSGRDTCEVAFHIPRDGGFQIVDKSWRRPYTHVGTCDQWWLDHMQQGHTRLEFLRQGNGIVQCLLGIRAKSRGTSTWWTVMVLPFRVQVSWNLLVLPHSNSYTKTASAA